MTFVNSWSPLAHALPAKDRQIETKVGDFLNGGATQHQHGKTDQGTSEHTRSNSSLLVSQRALEQLLETPQQQRGQDQGAKGDSSDQENLQVLVALYPDGTMSKDTTVLAPSNLAGQQSKVDQLAKLVSRQMDAALRSGPSVTQQPISMAIPLDARTGLKEVLITLNEGVLTVTIIRSADQAMYDVRTAAQNLAQILQSRYPAKTIKVAEKVDQDTESVNEAALADTLPIGRPRQFNYPSNEEDR